MIMIIMLSIFLQRGNNIKVKQTYVSARVVVITESAHYSKIYNRLLSSIQESYNDIVQCLYRYQYCIQRRAASLD